MKRKLALFLVCVMMLTTVLCSCGKKDSTDDTAKDTTGTTTTDTTTDSSDDAGDTAGDAVDAEDEYVFSLPLCEEKETLTVWNSMRMTYIESLNDISGIQAMEEATNVHIDYFTVGPTEATEKFGLLLASGEYPDMISEQSGASYPTGLESAVADGVYLDLTELYEKYMPNYRSYRESNDRVAKDTITDSGKIIGIYGLRCDDTATACEELPWLGWMVRQDWLDEAGLEAPVTIADWEEVLTVFKNDFGCDAPLMLGSGGYYTYDAILSAYGVTHDFYIEDGTTVKFGPAEEGYIQYLELMSDWYSKGLIDPNFTVNNASFMTMFPEYIGNNRTGIVQLAYTQVGDYMVRIGTTNDPDTYFTAINYPVLNEGDVSQSRCDSGNIVENPMVVTTACKNPELAVKWMDYCYTEEGMRHLTYGVEGENYTIDENGNFQLTDLMLNNPDGLTTDDTMNNLVKRNNGAGAGLISWQSVDKICTDPYQVEAKSIWYQDETSIRMPNKISLTADETAEISLDLTTLQTSRDEATVKVILGEMSIEEYRNQIEEYYSVMNLDRILEVYQAAYDRYQNRLNQ